jgi:predicted deacylase
MRRGEGPKVEVLVSGNIHAHELAGGQMVMALLHYFADNYETSLDAARLAEQLEVFFIPVMNPDRMAKAADMQSRWGVTTFLRKNEGEVDLNRNFPYPEDAPEKLKDSAGSPKPRAETYRGPEPFSEPETRAFDAFVAEHDFVLSLAYHTSGGLILYCPGTYPDPVPDTELMREIALAYQARQFQKYEVKPAIELYPTLGALDDYLYHRYGILSFTVEVGVARDMWANAASFHNGTLSPVFWAYNVYELEREKANNVPGALAMMEWAIKVAENPDWRQWRPAPEKWVGEP